VRSQVQAPPEEVAEDATPRRRCVQGHAFQRRWQDSWKRTAIGSDLHKDFTVATYNRLDRCSFLAAWRRDRAPAAAVENFCHGASRPFSVIFMVFVEEKVEIEKSLQSRLRWKTIHGAHVSHETPF